MIFNNNCNGNCNQGRTCDCVPDFTDSELGIEPLPTGFRWDLLALYVGTAALAIFVAMFTADVFR
jgi:hypothetical protein